MLHCRITPPRLLLLTRRTQCMRVFWAVQSHLRFSKRWSTDMWRCVVCRVVPDVSKDPSAFILKGQCCKKISSKRRQPQTQRNVPVVDLSACVPHVHVWQHAHEVSKRECLTPGTCVFFIGVPTLKMEASHRRKLASLKWFSLYCLKCVFNVTVWFIVLLRVNVYSQIVSVFSCVMCQVTEYRLTCLNNYLNL